MRNRGRQALVLAAVLTAGTPAPLAHADDFYQFQSPSGNISCVMAAFSGTPPEVACEIVDRMWDAWPPQPCDGEWGDRIALIQGSPPELACHSDTTRDIGLPTLAYGDTRTVASLTCASAPTGITCTDTGTGHSFRISRESYELR